MRQESFEVQEHPDETGLDDSYWELWTSFVQKALDAEAGLYSTHLE